MAKEKLTDEVVKSVNNVNNISSLLLKYAPLIIGLICLVVCYLLFKKIQTLNSHGDSVSKIEKQFTNFVKEQSEINSINGKKFNSIISQINQLSYIIQNSNTRESNSLSSQMSPERVQERGQEIGQEKSQERGQVRRQEREQQRQEKVIQQPVQRELMPTSVIQTSFPINVDSDTVPTPISTTNKKQNENNEINVDEKLNFKSNKKVIDLQTLKEEVLIEEASSDED